MELLLAPTAVWERPPRTSTWEELDGTGAGLTGRLWSCVLSVLVPTKLVVVLTVHNLLKRLSPPFPAPAESEWCDGGSGRAAKHEDPQLL